MNLNILNRVWLTLRFALSAIFLWAFLDKVFGWGFATASEKSWLLGNSPTVGFLKFGTTGPLSNWYQSMAGNPVVDWLFMMGLLLVGLGLFSGIMMRLACWGGAVMMLMIYFAVVPPKNNPVIDEHIIYIVVLVGLSASDAGARFGLGNWWSRTRLVNKYKWLA